MDQVTVTKITYNVAAALGWAGFVVGLVAAIALSAAPNPAGMVSLFFGLVCGGITITFAGPLRYKTTRVVSLRRSTPQRDQ